MPKRRKYKAELKREAVALANQPGVTKAQVNRNLGIDAIRAVKAQTLFLTSRNHPPTSLHWNGGPPFLISLFRKP